MHTIRMTSTCRRARDRAPADRLVLTTAGSSCGVIPTAMASENSSASTQERPSTMLATRIAPVRIRAITSRNDENRESPRWNSVCGSRRSKPAAMRPNSVLAPVATTTPRPRPDWTIVPMRAQQSRSPSSGDPGIGSIRFSTATDSPVMMLSSHRRSSASSSRRSAGTIAPGVSRTMSAGTSAPTSTSVRSPPRMTIARRRMRSCSETAVRAARYSFANPRAMLSTRIVAMTVAFSASPIAADTAAVTNSSSRMGLRTWFSSMRPAWVLSACTRFGPSRASRRAASSGSSPAGSASSARSSAGMSCVAAMTIGLRQSG